MREYGPAISYSAYQIDSIVKKWSFNENFAPVAYAILTTKREFNKTLKCRSFPFNHTEIRQKIADIYFKGDISFTICDLLSKSHFRCGAIRSNTAFPAEWRADLSYFECLHGCNDKNLFNLTKNGL